MFALTVTLWTVTVHLFSAVRTAGTGRHQLVCPSQPIVVTLGDDVILQCHVKPVVDLEGWTVTWWTADIPPDPGDPLSEHRFVHMYHNSHDVDDMKMKSYAGRTTLDKDGLKRGNVSLKITNVRLSDQARYRCVIPELMSASVVRLVVDPNTKETTTEITLHPRTVQPPEPKNETNITGGRSHLALILAVVFCVVLVLGGGVGGYLFLKLKHQQNLLKYDAASDKSLPV